MPLILDVSRDGDGVVDHDDHATIHVFATVIMTLLSSVLGYAQHPVRIKLYQDYIIIGYIVPMGPNFRRRREEEPVAKRPSRHGFLMFSPLTLTHYSKHEAYRTRRPYKWVTTWVTCGNATLRVLMSPPNTFL